MIQFQVESVAKWFTEAQPLIYQHWQELGLDTDLKGDVNVKKMATLEAEGMWATITVRDDSLSGSTLIGYLIALVSPHLHYQSSPPMFIIDMYYLAPAYRDGNGVKLFKFAESVAKERGCIKIYLSCKVHQDHSNLFNALGFKLSDYAFTKRI